MGIILGLKRDNGKENGNYYTILYTADFFSGLYTAILDLTRGA